VAIEVAPTSIVSPQAKLTASVSVRPFCVIEEEVEIGRLMSARLLGKFGHFHSDPAVTGYVETVGHALASRFGRPDLRFRFAVLDTDEVNALAAPGGYVFVTRGLLAQVRSEAELAVVLGHEIGHVDERHMYKEIQPKRDVSAGEALTGLLSQGRSALGASVIEAVNRGLALLLEEGLGREKEQEADVAGSLYAAGLGYDPMEFSSLLKRLHGARARIRLSKTHPPFEARIDHYEGFVATNGLRGAKTADRAVLERRFRAAMSGLYTAPGTAGREPGA